jgi:hypothetical protein
MKRKFDSLMPGNIVADMHGRSRSTIDWQIEEDVKISGWVVLEGTAVRNLMLSEVRLATSAPLWSYTNKMMHVIQETLQGYTCGFMYDMQWGVLCTIQLSPIHHKRGGLVVLSTGTHYLRCDTVMRKEAGYPEEEQEAYSLFCRDGDRRIAIYRGTMTWAINLATQEIASQLKEQVKKVDDAIENATRLVSQETT